MTRLRRSISTEEKCGA
ncbi:hypothetical protein AGR7A_Cc210288 [Agrobacterium deltaense NCPPB 1641]|uniref:Uncharacterized protein n=1 Tax=Agrobacterium deltaense NCPPB 1641 TaxID=1183425 RepID=A0A1S7TME6_9HYPH|nr:hypothetical protein AGR7A_Cc210288 [Agrobacterium deltaense NCPPB 1641]